MVKHINKLLVATLLLTCLPVSAQELPSVRPEEVGLSSKKLEKVDKIAEGLVASNRLAGATVIILRHGRAVSYTHLRLPTILLV